MGYDKEHVLSDEDEQVLYDLYEDPATSHAEKIRIKHMLVKNHASKKNNFLRKHHIDPYHHPGLAAIVTQLVILIEAVGISIKRFITGLPGLFKVSIACALIITLAIVCKFSVYETMHYVVEPVAKEVFHIFNVLMGCIKSVSKVAASAVNGVANGAIDVGNTISGWFGHHKKAHHVHVFKAPKLPHYSESMLGSKFHDLSHMEGICHGFCKDSWCAFHLILETMTSHNLCQVLRYLRPFPPVWIFNMIIYGRDYANMEKDNCHVKKHHDVCSLWYFWWAVTRIYILILWGFCAYCLYPIVRNCIKFIWTMGEVMSIYATIAYEDTALEEEELRFEVVAHRHVNNRHSLEEDKRKLSRITKEIAHTR